MSSMRWLLFALAFALLGLRSPAAAHRVRVFAVGSKVELRYAVSYQDFRDKMFALMDRNHPRRAELVQADADDVASHLAPTDPHAPNAALVGFPEDVGLVAGLIGSRGTRARQLTAHLGGSTGAFASLILKYQPQFQYYAERFPDQPSVRYLLLAETDTWYRAVYETFRDLARAYGVYVTANVNAPWARRIESRDEPDLVALLRDPDEASTRDYAYVAVSPQVFNTTFIFNPDGDVLVAAADGTVLRSPGETDGVLRGSLNKAYLTEVEEGTLPLSFGKVQDLDVIDTPVGRLAAVISKDAWMIDVNDRYDAKGANLILQPEAFSDWAYVASPWEPDGFKAGGFAQVQRNPSFLYNLAPCMTGNLYEVTFDGQSAVIGKRQKSASGAALAWIGQNPDSGFLSVAPWIIADPGLGDPTLGLSQRRTLLADAGTHLLPFPGAMPRCASPTSVGACENGYREAVIYADVQIPDGPQPSVPADLGPRTPTAFGSGVEVTSFLPAARQHARVATHAGNVYVVWQDGRHGYESIYLAVSSDRGGHFTEYRVSDNQAGTVVELRPALALSARGDRVFVVWQEFCSGRDDDCGRIKMARFDGTGRKMGTDVRVDQGGDGSGKWNAALAVTRGGVPLVAWVDERDAGADGLRFEHIYFARGRDHGARFPPSVRVDHGTPVTAAAQLDNKWSPAVAARGRNIYVAWTDFRNYNWDIYSAHSRSGLAFSTNARVDDFAQFERIDDHPSIAVDGVGVVHAIWADRRDTADNTNILYARSVDGGRHFSPNRQLDGSAAGFDPDQDTPSNQWNPRVAVSGDDVLAVWQDNRLGNNDIFFVRSRDHGASFDPVERVDDSGDGPSNQYRPDLAVDEADPGGRTLYVVWEDDRSGFSSVWLARRLF